VKPVVKQIEDEDEDEDEEVDIPAVFCTSYSRHLKPETISYLQHVVRKNPISA
jgi:hypothetical protein